MGFNPPVPQQDSDWEIRVAVLLSLLLQILLIFVGPTRKRSSSPIPRFTVWSCYLLADWVADLALGLLLNNMGNIGGGGNSSSSFGLKRGGGTIGNNNGSSSSPIIFAFWTPFLLLHLGGPDTITAYSLEDNELWLRHLIGLLFELFSACVIFFCSLHGNPLIHATVLVFVVGIIKYGERTYSLYSGSVDGFRNKILDPPEPGPNYAKLMTEFDAKEKAGLVVEIAIADGEASKAHKEMEEKETTRLVLDKTKSVEARAYEFFLVFRRLFVNVILSFRERRQSQAFFLERSDTTPKEAFDVIEVELNFIYDMVYTKAPLAEKTVSWVLRCICSCCLVSALVIFFFLDKPGHQILTVDVGITYALLLGGLALDVAALLMIFFSNRAKVYLEKPQRPRLLRWLASPRQAGKRWCQTRRWSGKTSQLNLITHSLGKPAHAWCCLWLNKVADCLGIDNIVDDFVFIRRVRINKRDENKFCSWLRSFFLIEWLRSIGRCIREKLPLVLKCIREKLIKPLVPKCIREKLPLVLKCCSKAGVHDTADDTEESNLLDFIFVGLKGSAQKLKSEQETKAQERKRKMEQETKASAAGTGTPQEEATKDESQEKDAMAEKDAIAEVCRRRGDGVVKSHEDEIKRVKGTTDGDGVVKSHEDEIKRVKGTTDGDGVVKSHEDEIKGVKGTTDGDGRYKVILDSVVKSDFDESLLLWHIATDLCRLKDKQGPPTKDTPRFRAIGKTLSEYMLYLLIKQPDMLAATAGIGLLRYRDTRAEAQRFFGSMAAWNQEHDHEDARRMLLSVNTTRRPAEVKGDRSKSVLFDAVILAKALRELDEELMWKVITGVWGEMLTYAAGKCRGNMHVRQLSRGGELITLVWFLMAHMGLGDMYQIQEGDAKAKLIVKDQ